VAREGYADKTSRTVNPYDTQELSNLLKAGNTHGEEEGIAPITMRKKQSATQKPELETESQVKEMANGGD
jgi:hypothetical protein